MEPFILPQPRDDGLPAQAQAESRSARPWV